ncbi:MAG TPA: hypothetical protein VF883_19190 [Thermoanaerobaculia bacterium]|jgi:membrane-associated phospholipid phosphatase
MGRTGDPVGPSRPGPSQHAARLISIAAHPLILSPITVALVSGDWRLTLLVIAGTMLPMTAVILWKVHRGVWSDFDVSRRDQRSGLYRVAIPLFALTALLAPLPPPFRRSMLALVAVLLVGFATGRYLKTSLHMLFCAFCAVILARAFPWSPTLLLPLAATLAWSRWHLGHHTPAELLAGTVLGTAAGLFTIL